MYGLVVDPNRTKKNTRVYSASVSDPVPRRVGIQDLSGSVFGIRTRVQGLKMMGC